MSLSTHVLDTGAGRPAAGVAVRLEKIILGFDGQPMGWRLITEAVTDEDGRIASLPADAAGRWRLVFDTAQRSAFFPEVTITFQIEDPAAHHHVPLLLAPFGISSYRGS
ncbi:hydroxyisourate hydrolase [Frankia sp. CNm7]|uniref:5-hydroxyisourate hydrolase n=1 Tax=Frankia nepalensis TaxID=1836974 RepID=A0A937UP89_9ACTN|nr:hydroxyisourate hydrolase [Frankia nepalensis]MBL7495510.1 hydroxyisourate hydrolase [Frankia nepalensis]MBL7510879.1 hydroxyisourate hydrolase [Frankia nepalensis]MBL7520412.1 hydroxyisourate hydrolase [Frankia nepalensis]MBL7630614.1 hydroxyisourate hydrolase [Frankia nepalensis]